VWTIANSDSKYLHNFQVSIGANLKSNLYRAEPGEAKIVYDVIMHLMHDLHGRSHVVVVYNFFSFPCLLMDLFAFGHFKNRHGLHKSY
jgi:hypothetical protein